MYYNKTYLLTLKTGVMAAENLALPLQEYITFIKSYIKLAKKYFKLW